MIDAVVSSIVRIIYHHHLLRSDERGRMSLSGDLTIFDYSTPFCLHLIPVDVVSQFMSAMRTTDEWER